MESNKTAMQQLIEKYDEIKNLDAQVVSMIMRGYMESLLPVEEQQIKDAYEVGWVACHDDGVSEPDNYYSSTYKTETDE